MAAKLDTRTRELLQAPNFCHVATLRRDGAPHVVPVWVDVDGDRVLMNSAEGRAWPSNLDRDPRTTLTIMNMANSYEYVMIRGHLAEKTTDGAEEHIDFLSEKYLGEPEYPFRQPGDVRVKVYIEPDTVRRHGTREGAD
jgi:PPOX class probable F420-dependent enzyme